MENWCCGSVCHSIRQPKTGLDLWKYSTRTDAPHGTSGNGTIAISTDLWSMKFQSSRDGPNWSSIGHRKGPISFHSIQKASFSGVGKSFNKSNGMSHVMMSQFFSMIELTDLVANIPVWITFIFLRVNDIWLLCHWIQLMHTHSFSGTWSLVLRNERFLSIDRTHGDRHISSKSQSSFCTDRWKRIHCKRENDDKKRPS